MAISSESANDVSLSTLRFMRSVLRQWTEATEEDLEHLKRYIRLHQKHVWLKSPRWQLLEDEINQVLAQARRVEVEARDYLQVELGYAALEETRKSIELSTSQIQESKRSKSSPSWLSSTFRSILRLPFSV